MATRGHDVLLLANTGTPSSPVYTAVGVQQGLSWETSRDLIEITGKADDHKRFTYGKRGDTVSLDAVYVPSDAAFAALKTALRDGTTILIRRSELGTEVEEATALVGSISHEAADNDAATVSISLTLDTAWTTV